tara:strand:- start:127 stop:279 length:153 start_codon:yes stop_codon:yes gene_type:complete
MRKSRHRIDSGRERRKRGERDVTDTNQVISIRILIPQLWNITNIQGQALN